MVEIVYLRQRTDGLSWKEILADTQRACLIREFEGKTQLDLITQAENWARKKFVELKCGTPGHPAELRWNFRGSPQGHYVMST